MANTTTANPAEYNGWTNYPTWVTKLWIDNDQAEYNYWTTVARDLAREDLPKGEYDPEDETPEQMRRRKVWALSESLKDAKEENCQLDGSVYGDLLSYALGCVNWMEIAEAMLDDADEVIEYERKNGLAEVDA